MVGQQRTDRRPRRRATVVSVLGELLLTAGVLALGSWNIVVGFGIMFIGFIMTTRWK